MSKMIHTLPLLDPAEFNPSTDYLIMQKINGPTYKCRGTTFVRKSDSGLKFLSTPIQIGHGSRGADISRTVTELDTPDHPNAHTALLSVRSDHGYYPSCTFYYYSSSEHSDDFKHVFTLQDQGTSQSLHDQIFVPIIDGKVYWSLSQRTHHSCNSWVYWHGYMV